jgi:hypothetical protein
MFWFIKKWKDDLKKTTKDPLCCNIRATSNDIISVLESKEYTVEDFEVGSLYTYLKMRIRGSLRKGIALSNGIVLEDYRGEDITAARSYTEAGVPKRIHIRFWNEGNCVYSVRAHTELDVNDLEHILKEDINYEQGCKWFREDVKGTSIKIL